MPYLKNRILIFAIEVWSSQYRCLEMSHGSNKGDFWWHPKVIVDAYQTGKKFTRWFPKEFELHQSSVRQTVYKWRQFNAITLPRSGQSTKISPSVRHVIFWEVSKNTKITSKELKASLALANVSVHETIIRKTLNNNGVLARKKALFPKKDIVACAQIVNEHVDMPENHWKNALWTDKTKIKFLAWVKSVKWVLVLIYDHNKLKLNWTVFQHTNFISSLKHGDGNITVCACFVASILGRPTITGLWILNCPSKFYRKVTGYLCS